METTYLKKNNAAVAASKESINQLKMETMENNVNEDMVSLAIKQQDITPEISSTFIDKLVEAVENPSTRLVISFKKKSGILCVYAVISYKSNITKKIYSAVDEELLIEILTAMRMGDTQRLKDYKVEGKSPLSTTADIVTDLFKQFMATSLRKRIENDFVPEGGKTYKHMVFTIARLRQVEFFIETTPIIESIISKAMNGDND